MVRIHWKIGYATGFGSPVPETEAEAWVRELNETYGEGTHWLVPVDEEGGA